MTEIEPSDHEYGRLVNSKRIVLVLLCAVALLILLFIRQSKPAEPSPTLPEVQSRLLTIKEGRLQLNGQTNAFLGWMMETNAHGGLLSRSFVSNGVLEGTSEGYYTNGQICESRCSRRR